MKKLRFHSKKLKISYHQKKCLNCKLAIAGNSKGLIFFTEYLICEYFKNPFAKCEKVKLAQWKTNIFLLPKKYA